MIDRTELWIVIILMGLGSFALRFMFTGLVGDREMPPWVLRHLRYTAVAILPGLVAPLVMWPAATDGQLDPARVSAAVVTFLLGYLTKNIFIALGGGVTTLYGLLYVMG